MATVIFSGAVSGNMTTAGNYVGGAAPSGGDSVVFDRGSQTVTTWAGVNLANVTVTPGFSGSFGSSGSPLAIDGNITGTLKVGGKQTFAYFSVNTAKTIATYSAETGNQTMAGLGTVTTTNVTNGCNAVLTTTALTTVNVVTADSSATVSTSATAITAANALGRLEVTDRDITNGWVEGSGSITTIGTAKFATSGTASTGGVISKKSYGTDALITVKGGGTLTNEGNTYMDNGSGTPPTVTSLVLWTNANYKPNGVGNSLSATITYIGSAGNGRPFDPIG